MVGNETGQMLDPGEFHTQLKSLGFMFRNDKGFKEWFHVIYIQENISTIDLLGQMLIMQTPMSTTRKIF
jgi:ribosomal protein L15E